MKRLKIKRRQALKSSENSVNGHKKGPKSSDGKYRVLLIDDDQDQLMLFEALLNKGGYQVVTAQSAKQGVNVLKEDPIDLIVCDVMMPQIDGEKLVQHLRKSKRCANIPIIMITAGGQEGEMTFLASGADMFCNKLEAHKNLLSQVRMLLN